MTINWIIENPSSDFYDSQFTQKFVLHSLTAYIVKFFQHNFSSEAFFTSFSLNIVTNASLRIVQIPFKLKLFKHFTQRSSETTFHSTNLYAFVLFMLLFSLCMMSLVFISIHISTIKSSSHWMSFPLQIKKRNAWILKL